MLCLDGEHGKHSTNFNSHMLTWGFGSKRHDAEVEPHAAVSMAENLFV